MPITISETVTDRVQNGGMRKIRQRFTDHLGKDHFRQFIAAADYDAAQGLVDGVAEVLRGLAQSEEVEYQEELIAGRNPFRNLDDSPKEPESQGRTALLHKILRHFLRHKDPIMLAKLAPFLARVNDTQLKNLLSISQIRVDRIRTKVAQVVAIRDAYDAFSPELGEDE